MSIVEFARYQPANPSAASSPADVEAFKLAMRHLAGAVSVITVGTGEHKTGFTATSVSSFSVEPPTILVSLNRESSSWPALLKAGSFAVNILAADQHDVADRFAGRGGIKGNDRYAGRDWAQLATGTWTLPEALAVVDCELEETIERHSHAILLGRVKSVITNTEHKPLLYWHGAYRHIVEGV